MFAEIIVNAPLSKRRVPYLNRTEGLSALGPTFTYAIPAHLEGTLQPGHLVTVPFGARQLQGIIMRLSTVSSVERVKEIDALADPLPVLTGAQLALAQWLSEYYQSPLIDCILQMFPAGLRSEVR